MLIEFEGNLIWTEISWAREMEKFFTPFFVGGKILVIYLLNFLWVTNSIFWKQQSLNLSRSETKEMFS